MEGTGRGELSGSQAQPPVFAISHPKDSRGQGLAPGTSQRLSALARGQRRPDAQTPTRRAVACCPAAPSPAQVLLEGWLPHSWSRGDCVSRLGTAGPLAGPSGHLPTQSQLPRPQTRAQCCRERPTGTRGAQPTAGPGQGYRGDSYVTAIQEVTSCPSRAFSLQHRTVLKHTQRKKTRRTWTALLPSGQSP